MHPIPVTEWRAEEWQKFTTEKTVDTVMCDPGPSISKCITSTSSVKEFRVIGFSLSRLTEPNIRIPGEARSRDTTTR